MNTRKLNIIITLAAFCTFAFILEVESNPTMDLYGGYDVVSVCMTNCAQCKRMYGAFFEGQLCAEACLEFKGKLIPDCEDVGSIAGFLNRGELKKYA